MSIHTVTITGADNSINPGELLKLSKEYSFLEHGILVSKKNFGIPRYPSLQWLDDLDIVRLGNEDVMKLSMHLCGSYVRDWLSGKNIDWTIDLEDYIHNFSRIQINTHNIKHEFSEKFIKSARTISKIPIEFIFQYDDANAKFVEEITKSGEINCSILFDASGGNGIEIDDVIPPIKGVKCGYAGGLNPKNLDQKIQQILEVTKDTPIWIDMESGVRSNHDYQFDLDKVRECLEISKKYIK